MLAEESERLCRRKNGDFGEALAPMSEDESFELGLFISGEVALRSFLKERFEAVSQGVLGSLVRMSSGCLLPVREKEPSETRDPEKTENPNESTITTNARAWRGLQFRWLGKTRWQSSSDGERNGVRGGS